MNEDKTTVEYAVKVIMFRLMQTNSNYMEGACMVDGKLMKFRVEIKELIE